ncbi:MAG: efflux RND transporter permease subunit [Candidatus Cloacimonetes bacterium]|nr:efflux RND transporter permease subunit [Candidatus Cloacimonadota bacterium]
MKITEFSLKRPVTLLMIFTSFIIIGIISLNLLPMEFFPAIDVPFVVVYIPYPSSTPEETEREITRPAEEVLAMISGVKQMISNSEQNGSYIQLMFKWGVDINIKVLEARERLDGIRHLFPDDVERFFVYKWSTGDMPILTIRLSSNRDLSDAYNLLDRNIKRKLERIDGVSKVKLYGVEKKEIEIQLILDKLIAHNIAINNLLDRLKSSDFSYTAGTIRDGKKKLIVRPIGKFRSISEIENLIIGRNGVRLKDVANITYEMPDLDYGRHLDRKYAIGLEILKSSDANTIEVTKRILKEIEEIKQIPEMEDIKIYFMDNLAEGITSSLFELLKAGMIGAILAFLVLFFFLRKLSSTFIIVLSVPFSILVAVTFMYFLGISLNILSMMGLLLAIGMLVDNAVVAMESIHRYQGFEKNRRKAVIIGVDQIGLAITAGTFTTMIVFLPNIINSRDQISIWIKHVGISFVIALGASLAIAQTIVPLLMYKIDSNKFRKYIQRMKIANVFNKLFIGKKKNLNNPIYTNPVERTSHTSLKKETLIDKLIILYSKILGWKLNHNKLSILIIFLVLISIAVPISIVKKDMFPPQEDRRIRIHYEINSSYTVEKVEEAVNTIEEYLYNNKDQLEIESVYSYYDPSYAMSTILLKKGNEAKRGQEDILEEIKQNMPKIAVGKPRFHWRRSGGETDKVRIQLTGKSSERLMQLAKEAARRLENIHGFEDVRPESETGEQEIHVIIDRERANRYGFSTMEIASVISTAMRGINLHSYRNEDGEIDVILRFQDKDKENLQSLKELPIFNKNNQMIKLDALADFKQERGPGSIHRENRITSIGVSMNLKNVTVDEAKKTIRKVMDNFNFPPRYSWSFGSSFDFESETNKTMMLNTLLALALIYFVMAALFESFIFPAAIWTSIIFAIVGVWWFFLLTGTVFSLMAWMGILILIGVVVNNGIVLIDHINQLRLSGISRNEAILQAGKERLRPILMTAGTTVLSLIPLCISRTQIGGNGPPYFPMARAIVGGLTFSTLVTLIILPTIYIILDDLRSWARRIVNKAR